MADLPRHQLLRTTVARALVALAALAVLAAVWAALAKPEPRTAPGSIVIGPYLQNAGPTAVTVLYAADAQVGGQVKFTPPGGREKSAGARLFETIGTAPEALYLYRARLTELQPGTDYQYRVVFNAADKAQAEKMAATFRTWPERADRSTFVVYGDSRSNPEAHGRIAAQFGGAKADFILHLGDAVLDGMNLELWQPEFFEPLVGVIDRVPLFFAIGNHDGPDKCVQRWFESPNGRLWYSFDCGPVHVAVLDGYDISPAMLEWLDKDLAAAKAPWKMVAYHEPTFNFGSHISDYGRTTVLPIMEKRCADFVLAAHSHIYERFLPLVPRGGPAGHVMTFITTAGGGAELYESNDHPLLVKATVEHHWCLFTVEAGRLTMRVVNGDGQEIDRLTVMKTAGRYDEAYLAQSKPLAQAILAQGLLRAQPPVFGRATAKGQVAESTLTFTFAGLAGPATARISLADKSAKNYELLTPAAELTPDKYGDFVLKLAVRPLVDVKVDDLARLQPILRFVITLEADGASETFETADAG